jgi:glutamate racemase
MNIGLFDSGLGGLTILASLQKRLKGVHLHYVADTQNAPYGQKSAQEILAYSLKITHHLISSYQIDALIIACNTATAFAIEHLRHLYPHLIIIGTEPGLKPALLETKSDKIGVLATPATLQGAKYQRLLERLSQKEHVTFFSQGCQGLVEQIERNQIDTKETQEMLQAWLLPMKREGVDTIVLGCTHYPLIKTEIHTIMGEETTIIETSDAIATHLLKRLTDEKSHRNNGATTTTIESTGTINNQLIEKILGYKVKPRKVYLIK